MNLLKCLLPKSQVIFRTTSPISGEIKVLQAGNERRLVVNGFVQSINADCAGIEKRVWGQMARLSKKYNKHAATCLILGLGGGTIVHLLRNTYPRIKIDVVEIDKKIIDVAKRYFGFKPSQDTIVTNADAYNVVLSTFHHNLLFRPYDLIFVDVYCGGDFPQKFLSRKFLEALSNLVKDDGCIILNIIIDSSTELEKIKNILGGVFRVLKVKGVNTFHNAGNILFVCKK